MPLKKLSTVLMLSICLSVFADDAPVVDATADSGSTTVAENTPDSAGGAWQMVSEAQDKSIDRNSAENNTDSSWEPVDAPKKIAASGSIDARVERMEQQLANYNRMNMPQQVSDLQQKVAQLQGKVEEDQHVISELTDQQKLFYQDVSRQLAQLQQGRAQQDTETATLKKTPLPTETDQQSTEFARATKKTKISMAAENDINAASNSKVADNDDRLSSSDNTELLGDADTYNKAFGALSKKQYGDATTQFKNYLKVYPRGKFAVSAHFWLGEIDLMHGKYDSAMKKFQTVVSTYPDSKKVPDAKLKIAMIHAATGKVSVAREEFTQIRKDYPGTTAAQLANIRLQQLASATSAV